jgi:hypothetical protein
MTLFGRHLYAPGQKLWAKLALRVGNKDLGVYLVLFNVDNIAMTRLT